MKHPSAKRVFVLWSIASVLWAVPVAAFFLSRWEQHHAPVERAYNLRELTCKARYRDAAALERCLAIMDLERFQSGSIMIANRALLTATPPLIGLGLLVYLRRRSSKRVTRRA